MTARKIAPYGSWKSPITSDLIVSSTIRLGQIVLDSQDIYWSEMRPSESGRNAIVRWRPGDGLEEVSPAGFNVRTRVHEYGGGAFTVKDEVIYFVNYFDQRLYRQFPLSEAEPITPGGGLRYADMVVDQRRNRILCVCEDHRISEQEAINTIVAVDPDGDEAGGEILVTGNDFYAAPRLSPNGQWLAWLTWNHPNMPWNGTELWVAEVGQDGRLGERTLVAGGRDESIFQPEWSPDNLLYFVSDRNDWWNLYRWRDNKVESLCEIEAEFGRPQWLFGACTYGFESAESLICTYTQQGTWLLARLDLVSGKLEPIECPYAQIGDIKVAAGFAVFSGGSPTSPSVIAQIDLDTHEIAVLRQASALTVDPGYLSEPRPIEYQVDGGETAHAFYYAPHNQDFEGPPGERPPLLVISHGGPTGAASNSLNLNLQYWTSRGFGVLDVNYGGSTGYGRPYRERLYGNWGIVDVRDCILGARFLVDQGEVDGHRLAIRGGSAGGYTTLCAITFHDVFSAAASHYGLSELDIFTKETHKFESRYLHQLVGPYPERKDLYYERSPINYVHQISCPLILFQGLEDKIVPPNQAVLMFEAVRAKELPVAYIPFEGEQHGFRQAPNIKRALDGELYFYSRIFGFELAVPVESVHIENLDP